MIIALSLVLLLICRIYFSIEDKNERRRFSLIIIAAALMLFAALTVLQVELAINGYADGTAGSDMSYYYEQSIQMADSEDILSKLASPQHAIGYMVWGALIEKYSIGRSVVWIKICNILIMLHLLVSLYLLLRTSNLSSRTALYSTGLVAVNGIIAWTAIRNLRDIIIMFLLIESILLMEKMFSGKSINIKHLIALPILIFILSRIRIFIVFFVLMALCIYIFQSIKYKLVKILGIIVLISMGFYIFNAYFGGGALSYYQNRIYNSSDNYTQREEVREAIGGGSALKRLVIGSVRYVFMPSPLSYLAVTISPDINVYDAHSYVGFIGTTLTTAATFMWWALLPLSLIAIFDRRLWMNKPFLVLIFIAFSYVLMYGYIFGGAAGTRQKIPIYIIGIIFAAAKLFDYKTKDLFICYSIIVIPLLLFTYYWAYSIQQTF